MTRGNADGIVELSYCVKVLAGCDLPSAGLNLRVFHQSIFHFFIILRQSQLGAMTIILNLPGGKKKLYSCPWRFTHMGFILFQLNYISDGRVRTRCPFYANRSMGTSEARGRERALGGRWDFRAGLAGKDEICRGEKTAKTRFISELYCWTYITLNSDTCR